MAQYPSGNIPQNQFRVDEMLESNSGALKMDSRPEIELLLCCARKSIDPERAERMRTLLLRGIDWVYLIRLAISNGLLSFLYNGLNSACPDIVPQTTMEQLGNQFEINLKRSLYLAKELTTLIRLFERHAIGVVPFKGPALAVYVYGDLSLRQFSDLDVLVCEPDVATARALLISQGYKQKLPSGGAEEVKRLASQNVYQFMRDDGKVVVELHWRLTPDYFSFPFNLEMSRESLQHISLEGSEVPTFRPEDLLLILCVHGCKHRWERLDWICDVAELVRSHEEINWADAIKQACTLGAERMLYIGLLLINEMLQVSLPQEVLEKVRNQPVIGLLAAQVNERIYWESGEVPDLLETPLTSEGIMIAALYFHLRMRERLRDKARYCAHLLYLALKPSKADQAIISLSASFSFLYYLLRPLRLVNQYGLSTTERLLTHLAKLLKL
jgi:hypothetical protein